MLIEDPAREYILQRGGDVTVELTTGSVCCGNVSLPPSVRLGKPYDAGKFTLTVLDGVNLYTDKRIPPSDALRLTLAGFFRYKYLAIEGWRIV